MITNASEYDIDIRLNVMKTFEPRYVDSLQFSCDFDSKGRGSMRLKSKTSKVLGISIKSNQEIEDYSFFIKFLAIPRVANKTKAFMEILQIRCM